MGLSASQGRLLLLTARKSDLEYRAQQISQQRLILAQSLNAISREYEEATSNKQMKIGLWLGGQQKGTDGSKNSQTSQNLTYSTLMSGTWSRCADYENIYGLCVPGGYSNTEGLATIGSYRLVNANGDIVVSSVDEIPSRYTSSEVRESSASAYKDSNHPDIKGLYKYSQGTVTINNGVSTSDVKTNIGASLSTGTNLADALSKYSGYPGFSFSCTTVYVETSTSTTQKGPDGKPLPGCSSGLEEQHAYVITYKDGNKTHNLFFDADGKELKDNETTRNNSDGSTSTTKVTVTEQTPLNRTQISEWVFDTNISDISHNITYTTINAGVPQQKGNNRYVDCEGNYYVVDPNLQGGNEGPNYLQECLRNGTYLIQSLDTSNNNTWTDASWDGLSCIEDSYYEADDAAAKAKYDRLQSEVQSKDKRLELELDEIETQHNAVKTEIESVEQVIKDNIEGSFNAFS